MRSQRARIHTGGDDRDGGASRCCGIAWEAWVKALVWAEGSEASAFDLVNWKEAREAFDEWWTTKATAGNESVDGLHPGDAR